MQSVLCDFAQRVVHDEFWASRDGVSERSFTFPPPLVPEAVHMYSAFIAAIKNTPQLAGNPSRLENNLKQHKALFGFATGVLAAQPLNPSMACDALRLMTHFAGLELPGSPPSVYANAKYVVVQAMLRFPGSHLVQSLGSWLLSVMWDMQTRAQSAFVVRAGSAEPLSKAALELRSEQKFVLQTSRFLTWALTFVSLVFKPAIRRTFLSPPCASDFAGGSGTHPPRADVQHYSCTR